MAEYKKEREEVTVNMKRLAGIGSPACGDQCVEAVEAGAGRPMWRRHVEAWSDERRGGAEG